jgi:hypothetical protein
VAIRSFFKNRIISVLPLRIPSAFQHRPPAPIEGRNQDTTLISDTPRLNLNSRLEAAYASSSDSAVNHSMARTIISRLKNYAVRRQRPPKPAFY